MYLRMFLAACAIWHATVASGAPSFEEPAQSILNVLLAGEYELVEQQFSDLHAMARETRDYGALRVAFGELFERPQRDRASHAENWHSVMPGSLYSNTAMAWVHIGRSWHYRDIYKNDFVSVEGRSAYREEHRLATLVIQRSLSIDPDFPPALNAAMMLAQMSGRRQHAEPIIERLFNHAPEIHAVNRGIATYSLTWGGTTAQNENFCQKYAHMVPEFGFDECYALFVFHNDLGGREKKRAARILEDVEGDHFEKFKATLYFNEWSDKPEAEDELIRIQRGTLNRYSNLRWQFRLIDRIDQAFDRPFYALEAKQEVIAFFYDRLLLHPQGYWDAYELLRHLGRSPRSVGATYRAADLAVLWPQMHELSQYSGFFWRFTAELAKALVDDVYVLDAQHDFYANSIYYGNHQPLLLQSALTHYYFAYKAALTAHEHSEHALGDPKELKSGLLCKAVRVSRLLEQACAGRSDQSCSFEAARDIDRSEVRRLWPTAQDCPYGLDTPIAELRYTPVPISEDIFRELMSD